MDKQAIKDLIYGGLTELVNNNAFYYTSSVGFEYNKFTEEGERALKDFISVMAVKMKEAETASLNKRAKDMVLRGLKGETKTSG